MKGLKPACPPQRRYVVVSRGLVTQRRVRFMKTTDQNLERHVRLLIDRWFSLEGARPADDDAEDGDVNVLLNCIGLVHAAAECTLTFLDADKDNRTPRGILARSIFELGITCVWLSLQGPEDLAALEYEQKRQQRALAKKLLAGPLKEKVRQPAEGRLGAEFGPAPKLANQARNFEDRVGSLEAGDTDLYALYRLYSDYAHASLRLANSYIVEDGEGNLSINVPSPHNAVNDHLGTAISPLVWAVNATDKLRYGRPLRSKLETMKMLLETGIDFTLKAAKA